MQEEKKISNKDDLILILQPDHPELKYQRRNHECKPTISWGQRKLLLTEIQFLTRFSEEFSSSPVLVYAGAAPGDHLAILHVLFPQFTFHLYDLRPFRLCETERLKIHEKYFDSTEAQKWRTAAKNVFFVSDIRTADLKLHTDPTIYEELIWKDMQQQQEWVRCMEPRRALLKFRLPYGSGYRAPQNSKVSYLDGTLFTQAYAKSSSTETRLVPLQTLSTKTWDIFQYENQMFHFNVMVRERRVFPNPITGKFEPLNRELVNDHDGLHEYAILSTYLQRFHHSTPENVQQLSHLITQTLSSKKTLSKLRAYLN